MKKLNTRELFKKKSTKIFLAAVAVITTLATVMVVSFIQTKTTALKETSPFYSTSYIERMFYVEGRGDMLVGVLRKYDGTDSGPLGWCLNQQKIMPSDTSVPYESFQGNADEWRWEIANGVYPTQQQVAAVQRTLYGYQFLFKNVLPDFGLEATDNMSLYHANQLAIWSILEGWTPDQVLIKEDVKANPEMYDLAKKIHSLFTRMYNYGMDTSNQTYVSGIKVVYDNTNNPVESITLTEDDYTQGLSMGYYRTKLIEAVPNQSYGYYYDGDYAFTYKVSLEGAPEGARVVNENGDPQDTFSTKPGVGLEFYVEIPASVMGSGNFKVNVQTTSFRRSAPMLWTPVVDTAYQAIIQNVTIPEEDTKSFTVSYNNTREFGLLTINKVAEQPNDSIYVESAYGRLYTIRYADLPLSNTTFDLLYKYDDMIFTATDGMEYFDGDRVKQNTLTTNTDGKATFDSIPLNAEENITEFTLKELSTKTGYIVNQAEYEASIDRSSSLSNSITVKNGRVKIDFSFKKLQETSNGNTPLKGAVFGVYTAQQVADVPADSLVGLMTSDENGLVSGKDLDLPMNYNFYIKELKTGNDLVLDSSIYTLNTTVSESTTITDGYAKVDVKDTNGNTVNELVNKQKTSSIAIVKKEERYDSESGTFTYQTITDPTGYEFKVFSDRAQRTLVATLNKDNFVDGKFVLNGLKKGIYFVSETAVNPMYHLNENTFEVNLDLTKENIVVIENDVDTFDVKLYKKDKTNPDNIKPLTNVKFDLVYDDHVLYTSVTDTDGVAFFSNVKRGITYEVVEHVPTGYIAPTEHLMIETDEVNSLWEGHIYNELSQKLGNIELTKVDSENQQPLQNATIGLYRSDDINYAQPLKIDTTDENGKVVFTNLDLNNEYLLHETVAPAGYLVAEDITVDMSNVRHGETKSVVMKDDKYYGNITVVKADKNTLKTLEGAKYGLYDKDMNLLEEGVSNTAGEILFKHYVEGTYLVKEIEAPKNYRLSNEVFEIELKSTMRSGAFVKVFDEAISVDLKIVKVDDEHRNVVIPNTEFAVYDADDTKRENVLYEGTTGEDGQLVFKDIPAKKYLVVETKAADGYEMMTRSVLVDLSNVEDGAIATLTVYNKKIEKPVDVDPIIVPEPIDPVDPEEPEKPIEEPEEPIIPITPDKPDPGNPEKPEEPSTPKLDIEVPKTGADNSALPWVITGAVVIALGILGLVVLFIKKKKNS